MLRIEGLSKRFGDLVALAGVDLQVAPGEVVGLLGANGAGKTTLNRIVAGLARADAGRVTIGGETLAEHPERVLARLGYLPETPFLYPDLTARETLEMVCDLRNVAGSPAWIERALGLLGLAPFAALPARALSLGMRRKLSLAVALAGDPELLLLDEPTNGLDPPSVVLFKEIVAFERGRGRALLLSSHVLGLVEGICDRVAILEAGRLAACGTLDGLRGQAALPEADLETLYLHYSGRARSEVAELFTPPTL